MIAKCNLTRSRPKVQRNRKKTKRECPVTSSASRDFVEVKASEIGLSCDGILDRGVHRGRPKYWSGSKDRREETSRIEYRPNEGFPSERKGSLKGRDGAH